MPKPTVTRTMHHGAYVYSTGPDTPTKTSTEALSFVHVRDRDGMIFKPGTQPDEQATGEKLWLVWVSPQVATKMTVRGQLYVYLNPDTTLATNGLGLADTKRILAEYNGGQCNLQQALDDLAASGHATSPSHVQLAMDTWGWVSAKKVHRQG